MGACVKTTTPHPDGTVVVTETPPDPALIDGISDGIRAVRTPVVTEEK